jgi:hypothetical protein
MAGYLDQYGVADRKRESAIKKIILVFVLAIAAYVAWLGDAFGVRTWSQARAVDGFLEMLAKQDYQAAYRMWGCTPETPCKAYDMGKFSEDWGPKSAYSKASQAKVENVDYCDAGVVFNLTFPGAEPVNLWVERATNVISFSPWPQCPGRHWQFRQFFKKLFS